MTELTRLQMAERVKGLARQYMLMQASDTELHAAIDALATVEAGSEWMPIDSAPEGVRVLLGPRNAPVVGTVSHPVPWQEGDLSCCVVHYNGNVLVAGYHCSEWHPLPAITAAPAEGGGASDPYLQTR